MPIKLFVHYLAYGRWTSFVGGINEKREVKHACCVDRSKSKLAS